MPKVKAVPGAVKVQPYKRPPRATKFLPSVRPQLMDDGELLDKEVQGMPASDLEERFSNALEKNARVHNYEFRVPYIAGRSMLGEVELDFAVYAPLLYPVQIDGEVGHSSAEQVAHDALNDALLNEKLKGIAAAPVVRIKWHQLETQADADQLVEEMF